MNTIPVKSAAKKPIGFPRGLCASCARPYKQGGGRKKSSVFCCACYFFAYPKPIRKPQRENIKKAISYVKNGLKKGKDINVLKYEAVKIFSCSSSWLKQRLKKEGIYKSNYCKFFDDTKYFDEQGKTFAKIAHKKKFHKYQKSELYRKTKSDEAKKRKSHLSLFTIDGKSKRWLKKP